MLKKNNGPVTFEGAPAEEEKVQPQFAMPPPQHSVNGYRGILPGNLRTDDDEVKPTESELNRGSARTRPFIASGFRKRKLLQSTNLHKISKKAARPW